MGADASATQASRVKFVVDENLGAGLVYEIRSGHPDEPSGERTSEKQAEIAELSQCANLLQQQINTDSL